MVELGHPPDTSPPAYIVERTRALVDNLTTRIEFLPDPATPTYKREVTELVAWFQHGYVKIHPFRDFNGRTARILSTYLLLQLGFSYVEIRGEEGADREKYIAAMRAADAYDLAPLQALVVEAITESGSG